MGSGWNPDHPRFRAGSKEGGTGRHPTRGLFDPFDPIQGNDPPSFFVPVSLPLHLQRRGSICPRKGEDPGIAPGWSRQALRWGSRNPVLPIPSPSARGVRKGTRPFRSHRTDPIGFRFPGDPKVRRTQPNRATVERKKETMAMRKANARMATNAWKLVLGDGKGRAALHTATNQDESRNGPWVEGQVRTDWTREQVAEVFHSPLLDLVHRAARVHRMHHDPRQVQKCTLLSIKTGGCPENCNYCSQSSHWSKDTGTKATKLMAIDEIYQAAVRAKAAGSTRFCMGAAWRGPSQVGKGQFGRVLETVKKVRALGMEVCTTLGMLTPEQAQQLRFAGLTAYNHNLDTSPEYYEKVTTTRKYRDRLETLKHVRDAGISVCSGGIIGLGEEEIDRIGLFLQLATLPEHPESVPVNSLVAVPGTPFEDHQEPTAFELVRCIATARILMPKSMVRLSAGRMKLGASDQAMCFLAGANSIFSGDELLTTKNNDEHEDKVLFQQLGLEGRPAFLPYSGGGPSSSGSDFEEVEDKEERAASQ